MNKPDIITINVRNYAGTHIATSKEVKVRASCTGSREWAAEACAAKVYGLKNFTLKKVTDQTWMAEALKTAAGCPPSSDLRPPTSLT